MDKFLERYNIPILIQKEMENMNRSIASNEIIKNLLTKKIPESGGFTGKFCQIFWEELISILKLFQKTAEEGIYPGLFHKATITLIPKPDKGITKKENYRSVSLMNKDAEILNKILANRTQ